MDMVKTFEKHGALSRVVLGLAVVVVLAPAFAGAAKADDHGRGRGGDRAWEAHEAHAHRYWHGPQVEVVPAPVVYAPPVVVMAPPPPPEGINLIIPLHIH